VKKKRAARTIELEVLLDDFREQAGNLSPDLRVRLENEIVGLLQKEPLFPPERKHHIRSRFVNKYLAQGKTMEEACEKASADPELMGHPAHAKPDMIKKSYYWVQCWLRARLLPKKPG
jgi:hypothetical protein